MSKIIEILKNPPLRMTEMEYNGVTISTATAADVDYPKWEARVISAMREDNWVSLEEVMRAIPPIISNEVK